MLKNKYYLYIKMSDPWENAVNQMISAINTDNNMRDYFIK